MENLGDNGECRNHNLGATALTQQFGDVSMDLEVPAGVWNPTPHGIHLANMIVSQEFTGMNVLELGTGCGIHAILIARQGAARMTLTEIDASIGECALHNCTKNGVRIPLEMMTADWTQLGPLGGGPGPFDAIVANPPYAMSGKRYRRYFIDTLIMEAHKLLKPGGMLFFVQSSMADIPRSIRAMEEWGMTVEIVGETDQPFRDYYHQDPVYMKEMAAIPGAYTVRDGVHHERLITFRAWLPE